MIGAAIHVTVQQSQTWASVFQQLSPGILALLVAAAAWLTGHSKPNRADVRQIATDVVNGATADTIRRAASTAAASTAAQVATHPADFTAPPPDPGSH